MVKLWLSCAWHGLGGATYWFSCDSVVCTASFRCGADVVSNVAPGFYTDQLRLRIGGASSGLICYGSASDGMLV